MADERSSGETVGPSDWAGQYWSLVSASRDDLGASDLEILAVAAHLMGDDDVSAEAWAGAYGRYLDTGEDANAARCSFWLALTLMLEGQMAHASGWLSRAQRAVGDIECEASGYLLIPALVGKLHSGDPDDALELAIEASRIGVRFDASDLIALAELGHGQALIARGDIAAGLTKLDDVMLSVEAGEVGLIASGIVYCAVILECMQVFDLARASEWTNALDAWCRSQPDLVPYRGQCLVHQSQLHQASGEWNEAVTAVRLALERLSDPPHPALGLACYQEAELLRLLGSFDAAAGAYERASRVGYEPMPGLALLSAARGEVDTASASIQRALRESSSRSSERPVLLSAAVEIFRAAGARDAAREAAEELGAVAAGSTSDVVRAMAREAAGAVLFDDGEIAGALGELRGAAAAWQKLMMPYQAARARVLVGLACAGLGDMTAASFEFEHARAVFVSLGAEPDLVRLRPLAEGLGNRSRPDSGRGTLSRRELEVLAHVAAGETSPQIAGELSISQHTVRRHLENIYAKLGVNSRAAATAYAYEHGLF